MLRVATRNETVPESKSHQSDQKSEQFLCYHAKTDRKPGSGIRPGVLDLEAPGSEQVFEVFKGVFVAVLRVNPLTLIELQRHIKGINSY